MIIAEGWRKGDVRVKGRLAVGGVTEKKKWRVLV